MSLDAGNLLIVAGLVACILLVWLGKSKASTGKLPDWAKLSLLINKTDYAVVLTKPDGSIEWVNAGFTRITGYEAKEASEKLLGTVTVTRE